MKVKQIPEDFIVEEIIDLKIDDKKQDYSIFRLTKKNWSTFNIIEKISERLQIPQKFIGYAGIKDRKAVTTQYISIYKINKEKIENLKIEDVNLEFVGYSKERINLGDLKENKFKITIRNLNKKIKLPKKLQLENYFDSQRFGKDNNTHEIGKLILKRNFKEVCKILNLEINNNDPIGALRKQPLKLLKFYISAYQSYIWNKNLNEIIKQNKSIKTIKSELGEISFSNKKIKPFKIPLLNFDTEEDIILTKIMKEENISKLDFIIKQIPELIYASIEREAFIEIKNIKSKFSKDELNKEKLKLVLEFNLPKGSYATMLIKKISLLLQ
ncbi:MAG TPA: tRNA pseudouridine(13) synthase TruD [Candidatus Nanoarchaeia archaeon]|nr:tRNA pseudouridine(13) synthase TruD [Candidatus Nanoarchaeia archaeon]